MKLPRRGGSHVPGVVVRLRSLHHSPPVQLYGQDRDGLWSAATFYPEPTMRLVLVTLAPWAALSLITSAHAGVTVALQRDNKNSVIYLEGNKMRVEGAHVDASNASLVIYDGDQQKVFLINQEKKTYQELTPQSFKAMFDKAKKIDQHMANMSPEQ